MNAVTGRILVCVFIGMFVSGCADFFYGQVRNSNRVAITKLSPGMSKSKVMKIMGDGPNITSVTLGDTISNPYSSAAYRVGDRVYEILYYYTDIKKRDGGITDDELTPVVLLNGKVDGWGWAYWNDIINRYEIRLR